ncbi:hypothetical protein, partial [Pseudomonas sp. PM2]|uniref:hypothetical protein n=1 Tax=Pseudomonas sp. PM2 TaxID=215172 RepID=UPI003FA21E13
EKFRDQVAKTFGGVGTFGGFGAMEEQVRRNMEIFDRTMKMFMPNGRAEEGLATVEKSDDLDELKRQVAEMQKRLDRIGEKGE